MSEENQRIEKLMIWATRASSLVALTLVVTKFYAWFYSQSVALFGSMLDSGLDLAASLMTLFAVKTAIQPADEDHRFGHGKAEAIAGLFQGSLMAGSAFFLLFESGRALLAPRPSVAQDLILGVSVFAIALTLVLVIFQSYVIKQSNSLAVQGDHLHYMGDLMLNCSVIASVFLANYGLTYADGIFGFLIAGYILKGSYDVARPSIDMLMDREVPFEERERIIQTASSVDGVKGIHEVRTRLSGRSTFIQMHIEVSGTLSVNEGHAIADLVEKALNKDFPEAETLVHIDPYQS
ncbi:cation diffusion facilitator family transporter [Temperatibacter marinus]|uniref:Protein p34 n=1 Tax=Temperatibacter marinus TaxID=1456591 RepID=A0AA52EF80_9PROT|nr:cation diffusion facilitator family transporter [Temperatibacter marinus]WND01998.1 cation diffusion facilitator family transporter [Temperatibacter marinus]